MVERTLGHFGSVRLVENTMLRDESMALIRNGKLVWIGKFGAPIEDADFDAVMLPPCKYALFQKLTGASND